MFTSVVLQAKSIDDLEGILNLNDRLHQSLTDWEMIVVCEGLDRESQATVERRLTTGSAVNVRSVFLAGRPLGQAATLWAGVDLAIGDLVASIFVTPTNTQELIDVLQTRPLPDILFGHCSGKTRGGWFANALDRAFRGGYRAINGKELTGTQPSIVLMSRQFINFLQKSSRPDLAMRNANIYSGFEKIETQISSAVQQSKLDIAASFGRAMEIIFSASVAPLRLISLFSLAGAGVNLIYSLYVLVVALTEKVTPGWTSMSLQLSGMFLLVTLVLAALSEFMIFAQRASSGDGRYFIKSQGSSRRDGFSERLNVTD